MSKSFIGSLLVIPVLILALSSFSNAQQPKKVPRLGFLSKPNMNKGRRFLKPKAVIRSLIPGAT
jgi:hypothetical protein